jgi:hypothetical protein
MIAKTLILTVVLGAGLFLAMTRSPGGQKIDLGRPMGR